MKKIVISAIAIGVMLVAAGFAIQPVQQATAIHATIQANTLRHFTLTATVTPDLTDVAAADEAATWAIPQPFRVLSITASNTVDAGNNCDMAAAIIATDLVSTFPLNEPNPAVANALGDERILIDTSIDAGFPPLFGSTILSVTTAEAANCAATDAETLTVVIETTGALTAAPAATTRTAAAAAALVAVAG